MSIPDRLGDFQIVEEIGRGGFGVVYRAQQVSLDRPVALKVLYEHRVHTDDEVARFEREARAAGRLDHGAIVSVYAWGEDKGSFFIAQNLVGCGRTAADQLADLAIKGEPPKGYYREVAERIARVADALQHAHERGIVHRDVKPSNILLDDTDQPYLGDFGLAKVEDGLELSRTGDFAGSPFYMSPEQADSRRGAVDHRSDIYALGVTLYELLTLRPPFQGRSSHEIIRKILTEEPKPPTKLAERVPSDLETICLKAMEKARARRYQSCEAMAHDLRSFLDGEPIGAAPPSTVSRIWRQARRHRQSVGLVTLGSALIVLAVVFLQSSSDQKDKLHAAEQQASLGRDIAGGGREMLQATGLQEKLDQALDDDKIADAKDLADKQRRWEGIVAQGADMLLELLPDIDDQETMNEIGETLQGDLPLVKAAEKIKEYLASQPVSEEAAEDPRLRQVSGWLDDATAFIGGFDSEAMGFQVPDLEGEATGELAKKVPRSIAPQPERGAPLFVPPAAPDGSRTGPARSARLIPTSLDDPDDGPSGSSQDTLKAAFPPEQVIPADNALLRNPATLETARTLPWFLRLDSMRNSAWPRTSSAAAASFSTTTDL